MGHPRRLARGGDGGAPGAGARAPTGAAGPGRDPVWPARSAPGLLPVIHAAAAGEVEAEGARLLAFAAGAAGGEAGDVRVVPFEA